VHAGNFDARSFAQAEMLVVSPGVSLREPHIARALERGIEVVGDVELFARVVTSPVLAITGSNGKSTVTALVGEMCRQQGRDVAVGGNIGLPVLDMLRTPEPELYVLELSSFQLETTSSLKAKCAAVLNISADHMDRYADVAEYARAKARIFAGAQTMVLNRDDELVMAMGVPGRRAVVFGLEEPRRSSDFGVRSVGGEAWLVRGPQPLMRAGDVPLAGRHNLANVLAAMAIADSAGISVDAMCRAIRQFKGLPHRCQLVLEHDGVRWINDSKGTNIGATIAALRGFDEPVVLIAGGEGKQQDFSELVPAIKGHVRVVVLMGEAAEDIAAAIGDDASVVRASDMRDAVRAAGEHALAGDVVLLSPACASFDLFRDYMHRGDEFVQAVRESCQ
jgi:UDP-N-acetylmuramoylalanine--D-glutamate ligase